MDVSIIICCYNSVSRIEETLKHLAFQELENLKCELILVDNCCEDDTVELAKSCWNQFGQQYPLVCIRENELGLSRAREAGILVANGDMILFCDDDNWLNPNYVRDAYLLMNSDECIGLVGGIGIPETEEMLPIWISQAPNRFACGPQSSESGILEERNWMYGAGLCVRRVVLLELLKSGFKSFLIDRKGEELSSGGDVELCYWFKLINKKLYYSDKLVFQHYIPKERLTSNYFTKLQMGIKKASVIHFNYECAIHYFNERSIIQKLRWLYHLRRDLNFLFRIRSYRNNYFSRLIKYNLT